MKKWLSVLAVMALALPARAYVLGPGDGSDEEGFVPPVRGENPPPPPANISSAETYVPYPGPPVTPMARSEKKMPPKPPVMFAKIKSERGELDWSTRPNDLNNLLKMMKELINVDYSMEVKSFGEVSTNPDSNPILYRTGHFRFELTPSERTRMREYLLKGGMIIFNAGMGSKPFYESAKAELAAIFPEAPVQRLSPDHPIFHAYYDLDRVKYRGGVRAAGYASEEPWLEGVTINCRVVAVVSRWGLDVGWDAVEDESMRAYSVDSAQKLGINIMAYATAQRAWAKQMAQALQFVDVPSGSSAGKVGFAQVVYNGEWKTRHKGPSVLLQQFNQKTDVPVKFAMKELKLTDPRIFETPLLYITGHEDFVLSAAEAAALQKYLDNGGVLFAEACCGRRAFDEALRRELRKVAPGKALVPIPPETMVYSLPNKLSAVGVTAALAAKAGGSGGTIAPRLEGVDYSGHFGVIYSPYGLAGGWEMTPNPYGFNYNETGAIQLGENILMYVLAP